MVIKVTWDKALAAVLVSREGVPVSSGAQGWK